MTSHNFYEVDMEIDDLASFLFTKNINNITTELSLGGIADNKDLFFFCLDLFGLALGHGPVGGALPADHAQLHHTQTVCQRRPL